MSFNFPFEDFESPQPPHDKDPELAGLELFLNNAELNEYNAAQAYLECLKKLNALLVEIGATKKLSSFGIIKTDLSKQRFTILNKFRRKIESQYPVLIHSSHLERRRFLRRCELESVQIYPKPLSGPRPGY